MNRRDLVYLLQRPPLIASDLILYQLPLAAGLISMPWQFGWWRTAVLAAAAYAYGGHKIVAAILAGVALRIGMPVWVVLATAAFVAGYGGILHTYFRIRQNGPPTIVRQLPPIRCRHVRKLAEHAVGLDARGHIGAAIDAYLRVLARHPFSGPCRTIIALHAAEAAMAFGCPQLTLTLSMAARGEAGDASSVDGRLRVRARVLRARAWALTTQHELARKELSAAEEIHVRDRRTRDAVHLAAPEILARAGELTTSEGLIEEVAKRRVSRVTGAELCLPTLAYGQALLDNGQAGEARACFASAQAMTEFDRYLREHTERLRRDATWTPSSWWARLAVWWAQAVEGKAAAAVAETGELTLEVAQELADATTLLVRTGHHERAARAQLTLASAEQHAGRLQAALDAAHRALDQRNSWAAVVVDSTATQRWSELAGRARDLAPSIARSIGDGDATAYLAEFKPASAVLGNPADTASVTHLAQALCRELAAHDPSIFQPTLLSMLEMLAKRLGELGQPDQALAAAREAVTLRQSQIDGGLERVAPLAFAVVQVGRCLQALQRTDEAITVLGESIPYFRDAIEANPKLREALAIVDTWLARLLMASDKGDEAVVFARDAAENYCLLAEERADGSLPEWATALGVLAEACERAERPFEAIDARSDQVDVYRELVQTDHSKYGEELADALIQLGRALTENGAAAEAIPVLDETLRLAQTLDEPADEGFSWAYASRGEAHRLAGHPEDALEDLTRAVEIDPDYVWALECRSLVHRAAGRRQLAFADLAHALAVDPDNKWVLQLQAALHLETGELPAAIADLDRAITIDHDFALALQSRGTAHRRLGRDADALADLERATRLEPADSWTRYQLAMVLRSSVSFRLW